MTQIGAFEAKNTLGALLDRVQEGEEIVITRHGRPVARLAPLESRRDAGAVKAAFDRISARAEATSDAKFDWEQLKQDRDFHRP